MKKIVITFILTTSASICFSQANTNKKNEVKKIKSPSLVTETAGQVKLSKTKQEYSSIQNEGTNNPLLNGYTAKMVKGKTIYVKETEVNNDQIKIKTVYKPN